MFSCVNVRAVFKTNKRDLSYIRVSPWLCLSGRIIIALSNSPNLSSVKHKSIFPCFHNLVIYFFACIKYFLKLHADYKYKIVHGRRVVLPVVHCQGVRKKKL